MPVDVVSGAHFTAAHDVEIWASVPLVFRRTYNTERLAQAPSVLGRGWTHEFGARLVRDLDGFRFFGHDGDEISFEGSEDDLREGGVLRNLSAFMELRREGTTLAVWHWHGWQGPVQKFVFDTRTGDSMRLGSIDTPAGHALRLSYDEYGRLVRIQQTVERRSLVLEYDSNGLLGRLRLDWPGWLEREPLTVAVYCYDPNRRLVKVTDAVGSETRYEYDEQDRLIAERSPSGSIAVMKYDIAGRCIEAGGSDGYSRRAFDYDAFAKRTLVTDSLGHVTVYQYNESGQIEQIVQPNGAVTATKFDELGRVTAISGPLAPDGVTIRRKKFDERGDLTEIEFAGGAKRGLEYNDTHQVTGIHDITGAVWRLRYERGAITAVENPAGDVTRYLRDAANVLSEIHTPWGNRIRVEHDEIWSREKQVDEVGLVLEFDYGIHFRIARIADAGGIISEIDYDALGRVIQIRSPDGGRREVRYTPDGQVARYVNARGGVSHFVWSPWKQCLQTTDQNGFSHTYQWDSEGRITGVLNAKREAAKFVYDEVGNVIEQRFFDGRVEHYRYDLNGNLVGLVRADGAQVEISVDELGNTLSVSANGELSRTYAYDAAGRVVCSETSDGAVKLRYDACSRLAEETQNKRSVRYVYGTHGNVVRREFEGSLAGILHLEYDVRARLIGIDDGKRTLQSFEYDARDFVTQRTMSGARERLESNYGGQITRQEIRGPGIEPSIVRAYQYDLEGNLTSVADSRAGTDSFTYDAGERLEAARLRGRDETYEYDPDGNLVLRGNVPFRIGTGDQLLAVGDIELDRDLNGNLRHLRSSRGTACHKWDSFGQLTAVEHATGVVSKYGYDGFGRRLWKEHGGRRTEFFWSGNDLLAEQTNGSLTEYATDRFWPHLIWQDGQPLHVVVSPLALPHELIDGSGHVVWSGTYDAWGTLVGSQGSSQGTHLRYPGQYFDSESGFHYNRFRYYDPRSGSYLSPDPTGFSGGPNLYLYATNPITYEDPLGLVCGKKSPQSVYVLTKGNPPVVVYVGITEDPVGRLSGHRTEKGTSFDHMQIIATTQCRRNARNIEGSLLHHIHSGNITSIAGMPVNTPLLNAPRTSTPGYYHGYVPGSPSIGQNGRQILTANNLAQRTSIIGTPMPR